MYAGVRRWSWGHVGLMAERHLVRKAKWEHLEVTLNIRKDFPQKRACADHEVEENETEESDEMMIFHMFLYVLKMFESFGMRIQELNVFVSRQALSNLAYKLSRIAWQSEVFMQNSDLGTPAPNPVPQCLKQVERERERKEREGIDAARSEELAADGVTRDGGDRARVAVVVDAAAGQQRGRATQERVKALAARQPVAMTVAAAAQPAGSNLAAAAPAMRRHTATHGSGRGVRRRLRGLAAAVDGGQRGGRTPASNTTVRRRLHGGGTRSSGSGGDDAAVVRHRLRQRIKRWCVRGWCDAAVKQRGGTSLDRSILNEGVIRQRATTR
ncbi:hypothetical protein Scep_019036 [Stephania cephalantha]|uniref:Uncharacterized protein n=1 Tax=Stephania cephalantha TaxID=152367 RepID=A0AAP0NKV9_9MAGN